MSYSKELLLKYTMGMFSLSTIQSDWLSYTVVSSTSYFTFHAVFIFVQTF